MGGTPLWAAFATASSIVVDKGVQASGFVDAGRHRLLSGNLPPFNAVGLIWVLMSESIQGSDGPVMPVIPVLPVIEGFITRPAVPPPGTIFALGWLMAELFDPRRRASRPSTPTSSSPRCLTWDRTPCWCSWRLS